MNPRTSRRRREVSAAMAEDSLRKNSMGKKCLAESCASTTRWGSADAIFLHKNEEIL